MTVSPTANRTIEPAAAVLTGTFPPGWVMRLDKWTLAKINMHDL